MPDKHQLLTYDDCLDIPNNCEGGGSLSTNLGRYYDECSPSLMVQLDKEMLQRFMMTMEHYLTEADVSQLRYAADCAVPFRKYALEDGDTEHIATLATLDNPLFVRPYRIGGFQAVAGELKHSCFFRLVQVIERLPAGLGMVAYAKAIDVRSNSDTDICSKTFASCIAYASVGKVVPLSKSVSKQLSVVQGYSYYPLRSEMKKQAAWEKITSILQDDFVRAEMQCQFGRKFNQLLFANAKSLLEYARMILHEYQQAGSIKVATDQKDVLKHPCNEQ